MQFWDNIINTAMMGTDKKQIDIHELPVDLAEISSAIRENPVTDREEKFIQLAAASFNYRQCGIVPVQKSISLTPAPVEEKQYCNEAALTVLKDIIHEESIPLLNFLLQHCHKKQQIVHPELVPQLLSTGLQHKKLQPLIAACCGKRGEWLSGFNTAWNFSLVQTQEELWHTGTPEQRKEVLRQALKSNPVMAREWMQQTWSQEDANTKISLLEILSLDCNKDDIQFLENLSTEKSKKVREEAQKLLKQIPGSSILQKYQDVLAQSVNIKKEKALLGMLNKTSLQFQLPANVPEDIFKSGIEKLSGQRSISDEGFILYQLISYTPPVFWESHLGCASPEVIELFKRTDEGKRMIPAIGLAAGRFGAAGWARLFINDENTFYQDLVPLLDKKEREHYLLQFIGVDNITDAAIQVALDEEEEWGVELTRKIFRYTAKNPYQFNRSFYNNLIHLMPVQIVSELEKCTPADEHFRTNWSNTSEIIIKLVTLKIQTIKAFT